MTILFATQSKAHENQSNLTTLTPKEISFVRISATAAVGNLEALNKEINTGLNKGLTVNQIKENLIHLYAYAGFPRSLRGLQTLMAVIEKRKAQGEQVTMGAEPSEIAEDKTKYDRGKAILEKLTGIPENGPKKGYAEFAPTIEIFLKEHLFADIFERDVLTYAERELITVSILSSLGAVEPMLKSHLIICLNVGYSQQQLKEFTKIIHQISGKAAGESADLVLKDVLSSK